MKARWLVVVAAAAAAFVGCDSSSHHLRPGALVVINAGVSGGGETAPVTIVGRVTAAGVSFMQSDSCDVELCDPVARFSANLTAFGGAPFETFGRLCATVQELYVEDCNNDAQIAALPNLNANDYLEKRVVVTFVDTVAQAAGGKQVGNCIASGTINSLDDPVLITGNCTIAGAGGDLFGGELDANGEGITLAILQAQTAIELSLLAQ